MDARPPDGAVTVLGHATVVVDLAGVRVVLDPVLRDRIGYLRRTTAAPAVEAVAGAGAVLLSHVHHDHLDGASLRRLGTRTPVIAPVGARRLLRAHRMTRILELAAGEQVALGGLHVTAVRADHRATRLPGGRVIPSLGYVLDGGPRVYFAGDTGLFDGMRDIGAGGLDVALVPVSGWGGRLPPGHMDPIAAAEAVGLLRPRIAVPFHWGTLQPIWWRRRSPAALREPAVAFALEVARRAPDVDVRILDDGDTLRLDRVGATPDVIPGG